MVDLEYTLLENIIEAKDATIRELQSTLKDLEGENLDLKRRLSEADMRDANPEFEVGQRDSETHQYKSEIEALKSTIAKDSSIQGALLRQIKTLASEKELLENKTRIASEITSSTLARQHEVSLSITVKGFEEKILKLEKEKNDSKSQLGDFKARTKKQTKELESKLNQATKKVEEQAKPSKTAHRQGIELERMSNTRSEQVPGQSLQAPSFSTHEQPSPSVSGLVTHFSGNGLSTGFNSLMPNISLVHPNTSGIVSTAGETSAPPLRSETSIITTDVPAGTRIRYRVRKRGWKKSKKKTS